MIDLPTMHCLGCRYPLDTVTSGRCPECGRHFDPTDTETFRRVLLHARQLTVTRSVMDAQTLMLQLEAEGIHALLEHTAPGIVEPAKCSVWVNRDDLERARAIKAAVASPDGGIRAPLQDGACLACGAIMAETEAICPECGWTYA